jgi:hypothetical protein
MNNEMLDNVSESVSDSIWQEMGKNHAKISAIVDKITKSIDLLICNDKKKISKIQKKITKWIITSQVNVGGEIERIITSIRNWITSAQLTNELILQNICVKAGIIKPGQGLDQFRLIEEAESKRSEWGGTLYLDCQCLMPVAERLLEVLMEIRDRISGIPVEYSNEIRSKEDPDNTEFVKLSGVNHLPDSNVELLT